MLIGGLFAVRRHREQKVDALLAEALAFQLEREAQPGTVPYDGAQRQIAVVQEARKRLHAAKIDAPSDLDARVAGLLAERSRA